MKRSQALFIIKEILESNGYDTQGDEIIEDILSGLEKAGMSPPFVDQIDENLDLIGRRWEPEDET